MNINFNSMADVHDQVTRSYNMSQIRGTNTRPELTVRHFLFSMGFRYILHDKRLPGKPDLVFPKYKTVIQVHGCFWHGHKGCRYFIIPGTRTMWWRSKIYRTRKKDLKNEDALQQLGWRTITVWECELKPLKKKRTLDILARKLVRRRN